MRATLRLAVGKSALALALAASGCALPRDEGRQFRERLRHIEGQPVQLLVAELGPTTPVEQGDRRVYGWNLLVISNTGVMECTLEVTTDQGGQVTASEMSGSDYACGSMVTDYRRREAHYRRNPGLREREAQEAARAIERLTGLRQSLNKPTPR